MNPNWAYPIESYSDIVQGTGLTCLEFAEQNPSQYGICDGPETPVGKPNLVTESQGTPPALLIENSVTANIYICTASQYIGQSPQHPPGR